jgi:hypothetical protein
MIKILIFNIQIVCFLIGISILILFFYCLTGTKYEVEEEELLTDEEIEFKKKLAECEPADFTGSCGTNER